MEKMKKKKKMEMRNVKKKKHTHIFQIKITLMKYTILGGIEPLLLSIPKRNLNNETLLHE